MSNPHDTPSPHSSAWDEQEKEDEISLSKGSGYSGGPADVPDKISDDDCGHGKYSFKTYKIDGEEVKGEISTLVTCDYCGEEFLAYYNFNHVEGDVAYYDGDDEEDVNDEDDADKEFSRGFRAGYRKGFDNGSTA